MQELDRYQDNIMKKALLCIASISIIMLSACTPMVKQEIIQLTPTSNVTRTTPNPEVETPIKTSVTVTPAKTQPNTLSLSALLPSCAEANFSPNKEWATGFCGNDETWIVNADQTVKWVISYGEYYGKKFDSGAGIITPEYWTADGQYLYLAIQRGVSGPVYFANGWELIRLDLENGQYSEILEPPQHGFYSFSFSSDGDYLAYIYQNREPLKLYLVNLKNDDTRSIALDTKYNQAGEIIWSPDKSKVVLAQAIVDYEGNNPDLFSVVIVDLENQSLQTIIQDNSLETNPRAWLEDNKIELIDIKGKSWVFDLASNSLNENTK